MDLSNKLVGVRRDDRESADPLTGARVLPVLPKSPEPERRAVLLGDGKGLLRLLTFDGLPLEEPVDRHDAAPAPVGVTERPKRAHRLALGVDRLAPAIGVLAPVGNYGAERELPGVMIAPANQQLLAGRAVPARRVVVEAAAMHVQTLDDSRGEKADYFG